MERSEGRERGGGSVDICKCEGLTEFGRASRASQDRLAMKLDIQGRDGVQGQVQIGGDRGGSVTFGDVEGDMMGREKST